MTEELLADYLVQDGSARKHPFPIDTQLGSLKKTNLHGFNIILTFLFSAYYQLYDSLLVSFLWCVYVRGPIKNTKTMSLFVI